MPKNTKHTFTINENLLTLCEIGDSGPTRMQVQTFFDQERAGGASVQAAIRNTEKSLRIWDLRVNSSGDTVVYYIDEAHLHESAPEGFVAYQDGMYRGYVRKKDGAGLRDLHQSGECPKDCAYCRGDNKVSTQFAKHEGQKAQAVAKHWKSGR
jgi:hypothetical protein